MNTLGALIGPGEQHSERSSRRAETPAAAAESRQPHPMRLLGDHEQVTIEKLRHHQQESGDAQRIESAKKLGQGSGGHQQQRRQRGEIALFHQQRRAPWLAGDPTKSGKRQRKRQDYRSPAQGTHHWKASRHHRRQQQAGVA